MRRAVETVSDKTNQWPFVVGTGVETRPECLMEYLKFGALSLSRRGVSACRPVAAPTLTMLRLLEMSEEIVPNYNI